MKLNCVNCGEPIPVENVNIEKTIAICPSCGEIFNFGDQVPVRKSKKIAQPAGVTIDEQPGGIRLNIEASAHIWKKGYYYAIAAFFAIIELIFLVLAVATNGGLGNLSAWFRILLTFSPIWLTVVAVQYFIFASALNVKEITLDQDTFQMKQGPLPLPFTGRRLSRSQIRSIEAQEIPNFGTYSPQKFYSVYVTLNDGSGFVLLNQIKRDHAYYIAQELTDALTEDEGVVDEEINKTALIEESARSRLRSW